MDVKPYAFGVDLGGTTVKIGFFSSDGTLQDKWEIPTRKDNSGEEILPDIAASLKDYVQNKGIDMSDIEGVGIDVPGAVLEGGIVNKCANLGWGVKPVREELKALLGGMEVRVANDANAAALGELHHAGGYKNAVMVTLGTGVGGGVILDGKIVTGSHGAGGEIGHMPVNPDETECCGCGKKGCLEQYASATGIARLAVRKLKDETVQTVLRNADPVSTKVVFDAAKAGDAAALEIVEKVCDILGRALASIACVVDPEIFIIGGGVSKAGPILTDTLQKYYKQYAFHASRETAFALASLGNDAGMYGAVRMIIAE